MKNLALTCLVLVTICIGLQAKNKVIVKPYFVARSTQMLEVEKVTLDKDVTIMDMKIFGSPEEKVCIRPTVTLQAGGKSYMLRKVEGIVTEGWSKADADGHLSFKLYFEPLPLDTKSFNFKEGDTDDCWKIYGIQLTGKRPKVTIPERLRHYNPGVLAPLPDPQIKKGTAVLSGKILGYDDMALDMSVAYYSWIPAGLQNEKVEIKADGSFHTEIPLMCPTCVQLKIGALNYVLCLCPGEETTVTLNLPEIYIPQSQWFKEESSSARTIWVEGAMAAFNTELVEHKYPLRLVANIMDLFKPIYGMTPVQFKEYVLKLLADKEKEVKSDKTLNDVYRSFVCWNLEIDAWGKIAGYQRLLKYAPMFSGVKDPHQVTAEELKVDSTYYDDLLKFSVVRNPDARYCMDYPSFALSQERIGRGKLPEDRFLSDLVSANIIVRQIDSDYKPMTAEQEQEVGAYQQADFREMVTAKNTALLALQAKNALKTGYKVCQLDSTVTGDHLLEALVAPYKGKVVLIDMWATWCGPCKRAMKQILPMKKELEGREIVYVYLAGDNSPESAWQNMIPDIHGDHYRVTKEQWNDFSKQMKVEGVPTYFIINKQGDIAYRSTGFPGVDQLKGELEKAEK